MGERYEEFKREFIQKLNEIREKEGISKSELAKRLGVNISRVSKIFNNKKLDSLSSLFAVANALGYEVEIKFRKK